VTTVWTGLSDGAVYALVALGYNIVFLSCGALNFANAALIMFGVFLMYAGLVTAHLPFGVTILIAAASVTVVALVQERLAIRPVRSAHGILVTTVGAATILSGAVRLGWGSDPLHVPFIGSPDPLTLLSGRVLIVELSLIIAAVVLSAATWLVLHRTMFGLAFLAVSENQEASVLRGLDARRLRLLAFAISGLLAGAVACLVGPKTLAYPDLGSALALEGFVALAIGGFGSVLGGLAGGLVIGMLQAVVASKLGSSYSDVFVLALLLAVLLLRPAGLLGQTRARVV
jgi:branched-chain amino acid transport system permease protein